MFKALLRFFIPAALAAAATVCQAAQLSTDARTAIPHDLQQLVVIDYRVMQNSTAAMNLRTRVMPPELKQFDQALSRFAVSDTAQSKASGGEGANIDEYVDQLAFALFRPSGSGKDSATPDVAVLGIAQGQFPTQDILANFRKKGIKPTLVRSNKLYPMGKTGMMACFVDESTMIFGGKDAVKAALDSRDGNTRSMLTNATMMDAMRSVDSAPLWSILDQKGTQTMMRQVLGEAGQLTDFATVEKRLVASWYSMDFQHGVKFDLTISTGDSFSAATISSLLNAGLVYRKMSGSDAEKQALSATDITSEAGRLTIHFATSDTEFASLLQSPLFQSMVH
ncbi:MAG: hypothetical protein WBE76_07520 [Terracidiphilus sp.]